MKTVLWQYCIIALGVYEVATAISSENSTASSSSTKPSTTGSILVSLKHHPGIITPSQEVGGSSGKSSENWGHWKRHHRGKLHKETRVKRLTPPSLPSKLSSIFSLSDKEKDKIQIPPATHYHVDTISSIKPVDFQADKINSNAYQNSLIVPSGLNVKFQSNENLSSPKMDFQEKLPREISAHDNNVVNYSGVALNASTNNKQHLTGSAMTSTNLLENNKSLMMEAQDVSKGTTTTRSSIIIIDNLDFFGDEILAKHEESDKPDSILDFWNNENSDHSFLHPQQLWSLWNTKSKHRDSVRTSESTSDSADHWPLRFSTSASYSSKNPREGFNGKVLENKSPKMVENHAKAMNENCGTMKILLKQDFAATFLSAVNISVILCAVILALRFWWKRVSKAKKLKVKSPSDSSEHQSHCPLAI